MNDNKTSKFTNIKTLEEFTDTDLKITFGIYWVMFEGKSRLLLRNGNAISTYSHYINTSPRECVGEIRDDVKEEFLKALAEMEIKKCE